MGGEVGWWVVVVVAVQSQYRFEIVPSPVAEKIAQRDVDSVVHLNQKVQMEENEDDAYADFQIPDDLTW